MNFVIGAVVIIIVIAGAAFFMSQKSSVSEPELNSQPDNERSEAASKKREEVEKKNCKEVVSKETKIIEEKECKEDDSIRKSDGIETSAKQTDQEKVGETNYGEKSNQNKLKEQLYRYINHELQSLFYTYNKDGWDNLNTLGEISSVLYKEKESIVEGLPTITGAMVKEYFSCIDFKEEENKIIGYVKDKEKLKKAFLQFMMPFYPYYYKQLSEGGLRHTALLQPNTLRLFQQLTGKKFRPGYRNRYTTGIRAFEWEKERYKVYGKDGKLLCDAVFGTDGIIEGYGQKKYTDETHSDWNIVEEGNWKNGTFEGGILRYEYKRPVE